MNDTVVWLLNFAVVNGYAIVFLAGFGLFGSVMAIFRSPVDASASSMLARVREREGLPESNRWDDVRRLLTRARRVTAVILTVVLGIALVAGIRGMSSQTWTRQYIWDHGVIATATVVDDFDEVVTFVAQDGRRYTLRNDFFSSAVMNQDEFHFMDESEHIRVRYLRDHPQAFVIDGASIGDDD